jgi:hypothetical protein
LRTVKITFAAKKIQSIPAGFDHTDAIEQSLNASSSNADIVLTFVDGQNIDLSYPTRANFFNQILKSAVRQRCRVRFCPRELSNLRPVL